MKSQRKIIIVIALSLQLFAVSSYAQAPKMVQIDASEKNKLSVTNLTKYTLYFEIDTLPRMLLYSTETNAITTKLNFKKLDLKNIPIRITYDSIVSTADSIRAEYQKTKQINENNNFKENILELLRASESFMNFSQQLGCLQFAGGSPRVELLSNTIIERFRADMSEAERIDMVQNALNSCCEKLDRQASFDRTYSLIEIRELKKSMPLTSSMDEVTTTSRRRR
jgi:hypothetical protein